MKTSLNPFLPLFFIVPLFSFAQTNQALNFNGESFVNLGNNVGNGIRTIELWFSLNEKIDPNLSDYQTLIAREVNAENEDEFSLWFRPASAGAEEGTLTFRFAEDVENQFRVFSDTNSWEAGIWYHVAVVIDPTLGIRMFIDGKLQSSSHPNTEPTGTRSEVTILGGLRMSSNEVIRYFNGKMDDVRFSTEVEYTDNFTPTCPNLLATTGTTGLWYFSGGNESMAADSSGMGNNGIISNARYIQSCVCEKGENIFLDGQNSVIDLGPSVGNGVRTIELWVKPFQDIVGDDTAYQTLVTREVNEVNEDEFALWFHPSTTDNPGQIVFRYSDDLDNQYRVFSDSNRWEAGVWYHVAVVIDPVEGTSMYIDGQKQRSSHPNNKATANVDVRTTVGAFGPTARRKFYGQIEDLHFASEPLYTSNFTPPCSDRQKEPSTLGLWNFNEGSGTVAVDSGNFRFDGIIQAATYSCGKVCPTVLSLSPRKTNESISLFPNPAVNQIRINISNPLRFLYQDATVKIISVSGRQVYSTTLKPYSQSVYIKFPDYLTEGIYYIHLSNHRGAFATEKLFIRNN